MSLVMIRPTVSIMMSHCRYPYGLHPQESNHIFSDAFELDSILKDPLNIYLLAHDAPESSVNKFSLCAPSEVDSRSGLRFALASCIKSTLASAFSPSITNYVSHSLLQQFRRLAHYRAVHGSSFANLCLTGWCIDTLQ